MKRSAHHKCCDDMSQAVTINNKLFTADVFDTFQKPYVIPALPLTAGKEVEYRELMNGIQGSAHRIHMAYADVETSAPIAQSLVDEVNTMRVGCFIPFGWDTSIYSHPLRVVVPTVVAMSPEERGKYDSILHRKLPMGNH